MNEKRYIVVPTEEYSENITLRLRRAFAIPDNNEIWIGYLIRQHRALRGITQAELGKLTGFGQKHIDKVENKIIKVPKGKFLQKMIEVLGEDFALGLSIIGISLNDEKS